MGWVVGESNDGKSKMMDECRIESDDGLKERSSRPSDRASAFYPSQLAWMFGRCMYDRSSDV